MKFKMIALAALVASASFAETESFNMTLTGDVIKDYCTIDAPLTSFDFGTIDTSDTSAYYSTYDEGGLGVKVYEHPTILQMSITCVAGTEYDIYPDIPNSGHTVGSSTVIWFNMAVHPGDASYGVWMGTQEHRLDMIADGDPQLIDVSMVFASTTGDLNDLEDSINTVVPWVLRTN